MTSPSFTAVGVDELPPTVRVSSITDEQRAIGTTIANILATGKAARSSEIFTAENASDEAVKLGRRKATDAGVKLVGLIKRLASIDPAFPYQGKMATQILTLGPTSFSFAIKPKVDEPEAAPEPEAPTTA